jgi:DNA modification methylase/ParB-like chromosome segregation protein Spo0J
MKFKVFDETSNRTIEIKTKQEYEILIPPLPDKDYQEIKESIKNDYQYFPIIVNEKGEIVDGHHRFKACQELNIEPKIEVKRFNNLLDEKRFVIESNLKRRHLEIHERAALAIELQNVEKEAAKDRQKLTQFSETNQPVKRLGKNLPNREEKEENKPISDKKDEKSYKQKEGNKSRERAAKQAKLSDETLRKYQYVLSKGKPDLVEKMTSGKIKIDKAYKIQKRDESRQKLLETASTVIQPSIENKEKNYDLKQGDFRDVSKDIPNNSVDLIFTDPPYSKEYLPLYEELVKLAIRVLKPEGSLVFYVGHVILDQVIRIFNNYSLSNNNTNNLGLKYWWTLAVKHSGRHTKIYSRYVFAEWKPLLWYVKGDKIDDLSISNTIGDHIESNPSLKIEHEWQQSTIEAEYIIKNLTLENHIILDPMMGSGTTGIAALNLKRKFIGIEKEQEIFLLAKARFVKMTDNTNSSLNPES